MLVLMGMACTVGNRHDALLFLDSLEPGFVQRYYCQMQTLRNKNNEHLYAIA